MANNGEFAIQTIGLTKTFRDFWGRQRVRAVDALDLAVRHREVYGLLGPNGSGKSTTIKMLLGLLFPSRGFIKILDSAPGDVKTNAHIGYLPEESHLYPYLTARETLDFYGRLFGLNTSERKRRTDSLLDMVGLTAAGRRLVGEFSKGMQRRIGLAQALINDPQLLILDEPTSGLDPLGTRQIKTLIKTLGQRGKTVLLCSHLLADVEDVCDRIGILYGGKMRREGHVDELLARSEMTEIRCPRLDDSTLDRLRATLAAQIPAAALDVHTPRDRLEDYFLRVVSEAQADAAETSGATAGAGVSDFLSSGESDSARALIDQLTAPERRPLPPEPVATEHLQTTSPPAQQPDKGLLQSLTHAQPESATTRIDPDERPDIKEQRRRQEQVDRSIIENLLERKKIDQPEISIDPEGKH